MGWNSVMREQEVIHISGPGVDLEIIIQKILFEKPRRAIVMIHQGEKQERYILPNQEGLRAISLPGNIWFEVRNLDPHQEVAEHVAHGVKIHISAERKYRIEKRYAG